MDMLKGQLSDVVIGQLSQNIGGANPQQTNMAAQGILSTLIGAVTQNASTQEGANSLFNALQKDHDGSLLDNVMDFLNPSKPNPVPERTANGEGIINHLLGDRTSDISQSISKVSGLDTGAISTLMTQLAPMFMGMLGKQTQKGGLDVSGLMGLLNNERTNIQQNQSQLSPFLNLLDSNQDGSVMDDVGGMLMKFFGK